MKLKDCKNILKVGMKVKEVRGGNASTCIQLWRGNTITISRISDSSVEFGHGCIRHNWDEDIELIILEPSWDNLQVGMELVFSDGDVMTVLEVGASGKTFLASKFNQKAIAHIWYTVEEVQKYGWKIKNSSPTPEVIEISGKKYDKAQVEERIKELKPL